MPSLDANGVGLYYEVTGDGQPLLFVHGVLNDYRCWKYQVEAFSGRYKTIAYSRRYSWPNTRSGDVMDSTPDNNAADLNELIDKLGVAPVHLVGHSYGGFVACDFATMYPEKIRSLTLVNAAVATMLVGNPQSPLAGLSLLLKYPSIVSSARGLQRRGRAASQALDKGDWENAARLMYSGLWDDPEAAPGLSEDFVKMTVDDARTIKEPQSKFPHLTAAETRKLGKPTLVVRGEKSAKWDLKISERLVEGIPGSESALIAGAGHFCFFEKPVEFNSRLSEFLVKQG